VEGNDAPVASRLHIIDPQDLVGRTGKDFWAKIVEYVTNHDEKNKTDPEHVCYRCTVNDDQYEDIIMYNELMDYIQKNAKNNEILWQFKRITGHQGPLRPGDPHYAGAKYNVQVEWGTGEIIYEALDVIATDDPVTCAVYARDNDLLDWPGWKWFRKLAAREKQLLRLVRQAKMRSFKSAPHYKFGHQIRANYDEAVAFDMANGNTKWQEATTLKMMQLFDYDCFKDGGIHGEAPNPKGYKKMRGRLAFDWKHNGCHKARYIAGGHLMDIPVDSLYSGVVSLRGLRIVTFLAELNDLDLWATDVGNAYLEALTEEKIYIITGPEFRELEGHILIIRKALYGLRTSGIRWHETIADCLRSLGFEPSRAERCVFRWPCNCMEGPKGYHWCLVQLVQIQAEGHQAYRVSS